MNATASAAGELRITTGEYDADGSGKLLYAHRGVLLDVTAGRLGEAPPMPSGAADSSVLEFGEAPKEMSGYTQRSVGGNLLISGNGLADASFELPGLVGADSIGWNSDRDQWWHSPLRGKFYFMYQTDGGTKFVVCTAPGACTEPVSVSGSGSDWFFDKKRSPVVYDAVSVVKLPLPCCVCITYAYFHFTDDALSSMSLLNTLGPTTFEASTGTAFSVATSTPADGSTGKAFTVRSYVLSTGATASTVISEAQLRAYVGAAPLKPGVIGGIVAGSVGGALLVVAIAVFLRRRAIQQSKYSSG